MLAQIQRRFAAEVITRKAAGGGYISSGLSADELLKVYSNNFYLSHVEALEITYPAVKRLVGDEFFKFISREFIRDIPHKSGDLTFFGEEFADFLSEHEGCAALSYLPDVARLEWAMELCYHVKDGSGEGLVIQSDYPLFDIWRFDGSANLDISNGGQDVLVWKENFEVLVKVMENK